WANALPYPVLHVSSEKIEGACYSWDFGDKALHDFCLKAFKVRSAWLDETRRETAKTCLAKWKEPELVASGLKEQGHNITLPNYMSLSRAARFLEPGDRFIGLSEAEYTAAILDSIKAVYRVRDAVGLKPLHRMTLIQPPLILTEPAFFRDAYKRF